MTQDAVLFAHCCTGGDLQELSEETTGHVADSPARSAGVSLGRPDGGLAAGRRGLSQPLAAERLAAADRSEGALPLDHATVIGTAAIGFLHRLRGGIAGVLVVVDVETEAEQRRLRSRHLGTCALPMPPLSAASLRRLFRAQRAVLGVPVIGPRDERSILRAARGRPGWISICLDLMHRPDYWHEGLPYVSLLCTDTEIALRLPAAGSPEGGANG